MATSLIEQVKAALFADPLIPHREGYDPTGLLQKLEAILTAPAVPTATLPHGPDDDQIDVGPGSRGAEGSPSPFEPRADADHIGDPGLSPQSAVMSERSSES